MRHGRTRRDQCSEGEPARWPCQASGCAASPSIPATRPATSDGGSDPVHVHTRIPVRPHSSATLDVMCGNWANRGLLCKVHRCEEIERISDRLPPRLFVDGESGYPGVSGIQNKK